MDFSLKTLSLPYFLSPSTPPSCFVFPSASCFSTRAQSGQSAHSRQASWHAAPHPLPFVSTSGQPFSTSAVSVNIYWPSFSSLPPLIFSVSYSICTKMCGLRMCMRRNRFNTCEFAYHLLLPSVQCCCAHNLVICPLSSQLLCIIHLAAMKGKRKKEREVIAVLSCSPLLSPLPRHNQSSCTGESERKKFCK